MFNPKHREKLTKTIIRTTVRYFSSRIRCSLISTHSILAAVH